MVLSFGIALVFTLAVSATPRIAPGLCHPDELAAARSAQSDARGRVLAALQFVGSGQPGAKVLRNLALAGDPDRERAEDRLLVMYSHLARAGLPIRCAARDESRCAATLLACDGGAAVALCPRFFHRGADARAKALVHAAAHLAGLADARAETWSRLVQAVRRAQPGVTAASESGSARTPQGRSRPRR